MTTGRFSWRLTSDPNVVQLIEGGRAISAVEYKRLEISRTGAWHKLAAILSDYDGLLCPVMTTTAPKVGASYLDLYAIDDTGRFHGLDLTAIFNLVTQCPALSVPAGFGKDGLPVGLQVVGRRFDDRGTLSIGAVIDRVLRFSERRPDI